MVAALSLVLVSASVHVAGAQVAVPGLPVPVDTPYTLIDDESRLHFEVGAEAPLRGNGPLTGYIYAFLTRPHFLDKDLYLRMVVAPVYASAELIHDRWPAEDSAIGVGLGGGLFSASQVEFPRRPVQGPAVVLRRLGRGDPHLLPPRPEALQPAAARRPDPRAPQVRLVRPQRGHIGPLPPA
jgi:hypothetical protein